MSKLRGSSSIMLRSLGDSQYTSSLSDFPVTCISSTMAIPRTFAREYSFFYGIVKYFVSYHYRYGETHVEIPLISPLLRDYPRQMDSYCKYKIYIGSMTSKTATTSCIPREPQTEGRTLLSKPSSKKRSRCKVV